MIRLTRAVIKLAAASYRRRKAERRLARVVALAELAEAGRALPVKPGSAT